ncbi:MAG: DUF305 domain-containing protein [Actinomycetota bacterium]|nr:DUF305 domain-containing protein [Actinomycetota bacterium]
MTLKARLPLRALAAGALVVGALFLVACGSDDGGDKAAGGGKGTPAEMAFLTGMVHHHGTAIEMAEIAKQRGQDQFVKGLGENIVTTQKGELTTMRSIHQRLFNSALKPDPGAHDGLGLSAEEAGMTHTPKTNEMLQTAKPFDRAFVDEMVPHHRGAVRMAEKVLEDSKDAELRKLAETIISTQKREIEEMSSFRKRKFGGPVPAKSMSGADSMGGGHGAGH